MVQQMTSVASVKAKLQTIAGLTPSNEWLEECVSALRHLVTATSMNVDEIASIVLKEVLSHDLRDVVRTTWEDNNDTTTTTNTMARQLRDAIRQSQHNERRKVVLPDSFRLLVQVEECIDVSCNAETRLAVVNPESVVVANENHHRHGSNHNSSSSGKRSLKVCYSDGYCGPNGHARYCTQQQQQQQNIPPFIAIEMTPIEHLYAHVPAGLKILLVGPMTLRNGVAGWHGGNAIVLGGSVAEMVQTQQQAIAMAQQRAGHGIDPTIKALIWNHPTAAEENEVDEAEGSSGDVVAATRTLVPPTGQQTPRLAAPVAAAPAPIISHPRNNQPVPRVSITPVNNDLTQRNRSGPNTTANPYASSGLVSNRLPFNSQPTVASTTAPLVRNTYSTSNSQHQNAPPRQESIALSHRTVASSSTVNSTSNMNMSSAVTTTTVAPRPLVAATIPNSSVPSSVESNSFPQLRHLLLQVSNDETAYRRTYGKVYSVRLKQVGPKLHFNIEKKRISTEKSKGEKQYEYVMVAKFGCESENDGVITCLVGSSILEPHFSVSPGEMRKLNRENRDKATELVREGGKAVQTCLYQLAYYEVTLLDSPEAYFNSPSDVRRLDGEKPVLFLTSRSA